MKNTYLMSSTTTVTFSSVVEAKDEMDAFEKMKKILTYRKGHIEKFDIATIDNTKISEIDEDVTEHLKKHKPFLFAGDLRKK
jgi:hypothetical protein|tara:strand:+ start:114 stop:359 length:246 start_codon:yes stop_codon:yes gene_type:complete